MGSGKTTLAKGLVDSLSAEGFKVSHLKFADPLYALQDVCLPILKEWGIRPEDMTKDGELLQILGTEYGRNKLGEDVWVNALKRRVGEVLKDEKSFVVIDDARFENEFMAFRDIALTVRLTADYGKRRARCSYWREDDKHPSEVGLDRFHDLQYFDLYLNTTEEPKDRILKSVVLKVLET